jgi:hypothetical protein
MNVMLSFFRHFEISSLCLTKYCNYFTLGCIASPLIKKGLSNYIFKEENLSKIILENVSFYLCRFFPDWFLRLTKFEKTALLRGEIFVPKERSS